MAIIAPGGPARALALSIRQPLASASILLQRWLSRPRASSICTDRMARLRDGMGWREIGQLVEGGNRDGKRCVATNRSRHGMLVPCIIKRRESYRDVHPHKGHLL